MNLPEPLKEALVTCCALHVIGVPDELISRFLQNEYGIEDQASKDMILTGKDTAVHAFEQHQVEIATLVASTEGDLSEDEIKDLLSSKQLHEDLVEPVLTIIGTSLFVQQLKPILTEMILEGKTLEEVENQLTPVESYADLVPILYGVIKSELQNADPAALPAKEGSPKMVILSGFLIAMMGLLVRWLVGSDLVFDLILIGLGAVFICYGAYQLSQEK